MVLPWDGLKLLGAALVQMMEYSNKHPVHHITDLSKEMIKSHKSGQQVR
jgi:hypothetical protein